MDESRNGTPRRSRDDLNWSYFRMGLVVGLAIAVVAVWITWEVMS